MVFKKEDWRKFKFNSHRRVTLNMDLTENGIKVDHFIVNDNAGFNKVLFHLKKYGFETNKSKDEKEMELKKETEQIKKELEQERKKKFNPLGKDMKW